MTHDYDELDPMRPGYLGGNFSDEQAQGPAGGWDRLAAELAPAAPARRRRAAWLWLPAALLLGLGTAGLIGYLQHTVADQPATLATKTGQPAASITDQGTVATGKAAESASSNPSHTGQANESLLHDNSTTTPAQATQEDAPEGKASATPLASTPASIGQQAIAKEGQSDLAHETSPISTSRRPSTTAITRPGIAYPQPSKIAQEARSAGIKAPRARQAQASKTRKTSKTHNNLQAQPGSLARAAHMAAAIAISDAPRYSPSRDEASTQAPSRAQPADAQPAKAEASYRIADEAIPYEGQKGVAPSSMLSSSTTSSEADPAMAVTTAYNKADPPVQPANANILAGQAIPGDNLQPGQALAIQPPGTAADSAVAKVLSTTAPKADSAQPATVAPAAEQRPAHVQWQVAVQAGVMSRSRQGVVIGQVADMRTRYMAGTPTPGAMLGLSVGRRLAGSLSVAASLEGQAWQEQITIEQTPLAQSVTATGAAGEYAVAYTAGTATRQVHHWATLGLAPGLSLSLQASRRVGLSAGAVYALLRQGDGSALAPRTWQATPTARLQIRYQLSGAWHLHGTVYLPTQDQLRAPALRLRSTSMAIGLGWSMR